MARRASRDLRREGYVVEGRCSGMREGGVHCGGERWGEERGRGTLWRGEVGGGEREEREDMRKAGV